MKKLIITFSILMAGMSLTSCGSQEECRPRGRGMVNLQNIENANSAQHTVSAIETVEIK